MLTEEQIETLFDRVSNDDPQVHIRFARAIESAVRAEYADVPPATILTEHEMRDMLIACRSSVKFDMNQMELTALKPSLSAVSRDVADKEAQRLALLLGRIDALAGTE
jgi:hypothetical protein